MQVSVTSHREREPLAFAAFEELALYVLRMEEAPEETELSIALVDPPEMARLNKQYRDVDAPTDVLSFGVTTLVRRRSGEPITLGDVVIAPEIAEAHAAELGTTVESELNLLLVHGILHLLGYDHESDEDAQVMQERERVLLDGYQTS